MIEQLARLGYASKSVIYAVMGYLALAAAMRRGGRVTDMYGALHEIFDERFGRVLLFVLAIGLFGYAAWRILDAIRDPDKHGTEFKGLVTRIGNVVRALIYGAVGIEAFQLASRGSGTSNGREAQTWTARVMDVPLGEWIVAILGAIVVIYGVSEIVASFRSGYSKTLDVTPIPTQHRRTFETISAIGIGARGVIITVVGIFLLRAAFEQDASEAHGIRDSLQELVRAVPGRWAMALIGVGFLCYAFDQAVHVWCRRIKPVL
jgi:hypothetical protein